MDFAITKVTIKHFQSLLYAKKADEFVFSKSSHRTWLTFPYHKFCQWDFAMKYYEQNNKCRLDEKKKKMLKWVVICFIWCMKPKPL